MGPYPWSEIFIDRGSSTAVNLESKLWNRRVNVIATWNSGIWSSRSTTVTKMEISPHYQNRPSIPVWAGAEGWNSPCDRPTMRLMLSSIFWTTASLVGKKYDPNAKEVFNHRVIGDPRGQQRFL